MIGLSSITLISSLSSDLSSLISATSFFSLVSSTFLCLPLCCFLFFKHGHHLTPEQNGFHVSVSMSSHILCDELRATATMRLQTSERLLRTKHQPGHLESRGPTVMELVHPGAFQEICQGVTRIGVASKLLVFQLAIAVRLQSARCLPSRLPQALLPPSSARCSSDCCFKC